MNSDMIVAVIIAAVGGGGLATIVRVIGDRGKDQATAKQTDVQTLRDIIAEVRSDKAADDQRIAHLEERVRKLEERERHMLTRAAVHEAWDALTFQTILAHVPNHPPPPPLRPTPIEAKQTDLPDDGNPA